MMSLTTMSHHSLHSQWSKSLEYLFHRIVFSVLFLGLTPISLCAAQYPSQQTPDSLAIKVCADDVKSVENIFDYNFQITFSPAMSPMTSLGLAASRVNWRQELCLLAWMAIRCPSITSVVSSLSNTLLHDPFWILFQEEMMRMPVNWVSSLRRNQPQATRSKLSGPLLIQTRQRRI